LITLKIVKMMGNRSLSYKDVALVPEYSNVLSRENVDTKVVLGKWAFKSPIVPANMKCCISPKKAKELGKAGYFYVLHRFLHDNEILNFIKDNQKESMPISISVGIKQEHLELLDEIKKKGYRVDFITIDVAHGDHSEVHATIQYIRQYLNLGAFVIAGNVGTVSGALKLEQHGANAVKVGLSMGHACTTYNNTGVGTPMFTAVWDIAESVDIPVIADGQVREVGDICKALAAGGDMVMVGSMFAACEDSPAPTEEIVRMNLPNQPIAKYYYGNASKRNKEESGQIAHYVEGMEKKLDIAPYTMLEFFDIANDGIRSCCSYGGNHSVKALSINRMNYVEL
jgi:GMP reductase